MLFSPTSGARRQPRGAAAGGHGASDEEGRLPARAAPAGAQQGQRHLHPAGLAAPRGGRAPAGSPVLLVVRGRLLLCVVFLRLFALQEDVVAAGSCRENVLQDPGGWMLEAVFIVNVQLMNFQTQE